MWAVGGERGKEFRGERDIFEKNVKCSYASYFITPWALFVFTHISY